MIITVLTITKNLKPFPPRRTEITDVVKVRESRKWVREGSRRW